LPKRADYEQEPHSLIPALYNQYQFSMFILYPMNLIHRKKKGLPRVGTALALLRKTFLCCIAPRGV